MDLKSYLREADVSLAKFAEKIGEPTGTIHKIVYRQRQPSLPLAVKISAATEGKVQPEDMLLEAA